MTAQLFSLAEERAKRTASTSPPGSMTARRTSRYRADVCKRPAITQRELDSVLGADFAPEPCDMLEILRNVRDGLESPQ